MLVTAPAPSTDTILYVGGLFTGNLNLINLSTPSLFVPTQPPNATSV
jgi:hypothetical protein